MKLEDLKPGMTIGLDDGFTCLAAGNHEVAKDDKGFYVPCSHGPHRLDGQVQEDGTLAGVLSPFKKHEQGPCPVSPATEVIALMGDGSTMGPLPAHAMDWNYPGDPIIAFTTP